MAKERLTAGRVRDFACEPGVAQSFLWDTETAGLGVRATVGSDKRAFIFQGKLGGKSLRMTIGDVRTWGIDEARKEARRLQALIDRGIDPRDERRQLDEQRAERRRIAERQEVRVSCAWDRYVETRSPRWSERHIADHAVMTKQGGEAWTRGRKGGATVTEPGPLAPLLALKLSELTPPRVGEWLRGEVDRRPTRAALAFRLLRAFVRWCSEQSEYADVVPHDACATRGVRERVPAVKAKQDVLLREQLPAWFAAVRQLSNPVVAAYLQALLLTGARREELARIKWDDVDFRWGRMTIRDKAETAKHGEGEGFRVIPLTPYVAALLNALPRRVAVVNGKPETNPWVFSSPYSASGRIQDPREGHGRACLAAGIDALTLHGLRRSFGSLAEWVEIPTGVVAQIQGHKPSATAEKHYRVRPVDLLAVWHGKFEAWILEQAGIAFDAEKVVAPLRIVGQ
ncbi:tyrosine-type recombinase/integrase [Niveibacterium sp.]|uniref:tyrosine-type recombinase/integrase n=1 Tax=Niveibacterium sp. TaxID=2017444 RepID=UPI0035B2C79D